MLIRLVSDTHLETGKTISIPKMGTDKDTVLVLAGDIGYPEHVFPLVEELMSNFLAIIYVTGNHEYYDVTSDKEEIDNIIEAKFDQYENAHFLQNDKIVIRGVTFLGSTLWSSFVDKLWAMGNIRHQLNDFRLIKYFPKQDDEKEIHGFIRPLTPEVMAEWNKESVKYLTDTISRTSGDIVVVTHFTPSIKSTHNNYFGDVLNPYFHNNLEHMLATNKLTWLHGHTHASCKYSLNDSDVYCNPWGYYDIYVENPDYDPYLLIEV